ncbi:hypothetical protein [Halomonas sp. NO4]|uniref:hypothetical protein n=1 Tax=Halomonas sp. NO4 TaxID=2484813 RepID=UPI0013D8B577|nr:hypothetical protein [Halomonas sp. NO4]
MADQIEQIKQAGNKEALAPLAEELGVELDKRKGLETLRADVLAAAEKAQEPTEKASGDTHHLAGQGKAAKDGKKDGKKGRYLKNTTTGRVFTYSARLAKRKDMKEV